MPAPDRPTTGVTPYLTIRKGHGAEALQFYSRAFAGEIIERTYAEDGKRLLQASLKMNNGWIMLTDAFPEWGHNPGPRNAPRCICRWTTPTHGSTAPLKPAAPLDVL